MQENKPEQALEHLMQHLHQYRGHAGGFFQAGRLLYSLSRWQEALAALLEASRIDPEPGDFQSYLAGTYRRLQQPGPAIRHFTKYLEKNNDPEIFYYRSMTMLLDGRMPEGWAEYESRIRSAQLGRRYTWHPAEKSWRGQPFPGQTLLIYNEQGFGDDLQFCRYLPFVKALGGTVIFATRPQLVPIMTTQYGADRVIGHNQITGPLEPVHYDWVVPLMSLPHIFRTTLETIPNEIPYLSVPPGYREKWQALLAPHLGRSGIRNIGFVFHSANDPHIRTCPLSQWLPLFSLPDIRWFCAQNGPATVAVKELAATHPNLVDLSDQFTDFADTAAFLEKLDLLISIDTSVPHLAGALGKPAWMLLPFDGEWRWLMNRSDSPWYPSFRLFRQPVPGQWEPVIAKVRRAIMAL